ncbi:hypothetical protein M0R45_005017 [Rubus argutus]|uniref:Uncharacterized protein n=1 Tax=Rubus argutus TaxID=59490 RepID=A0AAW1YLI8_RUBAR
MWWLREGSNCKEERRPGFVAAEMAKDRTGVCWGRGQIGAGWLEAGMHDVDGVTADDTGGASDDGDNDRRAAELLNDLGSWKL